MATWSFDSHSFSKYSITEILVLPSLEIHKLLIEISRQFPSSLFLDTIGNLSLSGELNLKVINIYSIRKLLRELNKLKSNNIDMLLVIDSVSFLSDINVPVYTYFYSLLSSLCLKSKCTVICTNHYRKTGKNSFGPKLGVIWGNLVMHRIFYKFKKDKIVYEVES